ncbi:hypothetical protein EBU71_16090 [bacterium]|nr:hypothetical protein [Candidatus Elulimicrobium humile]
MRLSSQSSQFQFNLPSDFLPQEILSTYTPILEKNWVQYENVLDYLNSTIKSVNFPGISIATPEQRLIRGKIRAYKPATNVQDILSSHELSVKFRSVDADLNYWLVYDIVSKHYLDVLNLYINPFILTALDIWRDAIYRIRFYELIAMSLGEITFDYSQQKTNAKEFTLTFKFNFTDVEFLLDKSKVLELGSLPTIIQKI